tara:strand:- start:146 stop:478 length:333 start_codon:yes stop_codon:yes gene_type:complete
MKKGPFKMKGFSGFGVSPVKQKGERDKPQREPKKPKRTNFNVSNPPVKPNGNGGTLRPISGFEFDFPKTKKVIDTMIDTYNPKQVMKRSKKLVKNVSKKAKQGIDYFRAR